MTPIRYPQYADRCGWDALLPPRKAHAPLETDVDADHVVIGAGYTGLAAARRLHELQPDARIVVLEATTVGQGASARNSGFASVNILPRGAGREMAETAARQSRLFADAFAWLKATLDDNGIDCELVKAGAIRAAATTLGQASLQHSIELARANSVPHEILDRAAIRERTGSDYYRAGVFLPSVSLLQPAALIRGLADCLPGAVLHENSPVLEMCRDGSGWRVVTDRASVRAKTVTLATNGFIPQFGYLKSRMATIFTYAAITPALTGSDLDQLGSAPAWGVLPSHRLGTTSRRIGPDRLMIRSLYSYETAVDAQNAQSRLKDCMVRRWPGLAHVDFEHVWGGATALTLNGSPWWGRLEDGLFASGGCNGSGLVKGTMLGAKLAELICGEGSPERDVAVMGRASWMAPEPFRKTGFALVSAVERRRAGHEI